MVGGSTPPSSLPSAESGGGGGGGGGRGVAHYDQRWMIYYSVKRVGQLSANFACEPKSKFERVS